jgi:hypothetical protein
MCVSAFNQTPPESTQGWLTTNLAAGLGGALEVVNVASAPHPATEASNNAQMAVAETYRVRLTVPIIADGQMALS